MKDLRERRRLATESEIEDAALDLFEQRGFEGTTVDGIAARVGMSQRTFFRYFATKEDAALGPNRAFEALLAGRVAGTSTLRDVKEAVADVLGELGSSRPDVVRRMVRVRRLVMRTRRCAARPCGGKPNSASGSCGCWPQRRAARRWIRGPVSWPRR
ncbi:TetR family transcriptional regulator [Streptomyces violaceus]|uniref:TetR family transcriptional regulator n=1 Tax=Streptomyces violaceus TaxID=1936 RepID=A0ABY9UNX2_STRVL|nr:TetR family transcriptional regulator [Streptomyces janthinus]WND23982.1 TetR family transcriptional regulator [Streptomyces janthinus]